MRGDAGGTVAPPPVDASETAAAGTARDIDSRRAEVVERLLERGMSVRVLHALLPGWEHTIRTVTSDGDGRP